MKSNCSIKNIYLITANAALPPAVSRGRWRTLQLPDSHSKRTITSKSIDKVTGYLIRNRKWVGKPKLTQTHKSTRIEGWMLLPPYNVKGRIIYRIKQL